MSETILQSLLDRSKTKGLWDQHHIISYDLKNSKLLFESKQLIDNECLFDVASLTKILVTDFLFRSLSQKDGWNLNTSLENFVPNFFKDSTLNYLKTLTLEDLLTHRSGLLPWRNFYTQCSELPPCSYDSLMQRVFGSCPWDQNKKSQIVYSDLGFILLSYLLQKKYKTNFSQLFQNEIKQNFSPKNFYGFSPSDEIRKTCVSTGFCNVRRENLKGIVHDENAWALGGVSGHAGLFASAEDILGFMQKVFSTEQIREDLKSLNLLAWRKMTPDTDSSQLVEYKGEDLIGHFGFTGTSLWVSPNKGILSLVLTNRVAKGRIPSEGYKQHRNDLIYALQLL